LAEYASYHASSGFDLPCAALQRIVGNWMIVFVVVFMISFAGICWRCPKATMNLLWSYEPPDLQMAKFCRDL